MKLPAFNVSSLAEHEQHTQRAAQLRAGTLYVTGVEYAQEGDREMAEAAWDMSDAWFNHALTLQN